MPAGNRYVSALREYRLGPMLGMVERGPACFDFALYLEASPDLAASLPHSLPHLWHHWVHHGQFEERPHAFHCPPCAAPAGL